MQGLVPVIPGDLFHSPLFQPVQSLVKLLVFGAEAAWLCDRDLTSVEAFEFSPRQCSLSAGTVRFRGVWGGSPRGSGCQEMQSWLVTLGNGELWFSSVRRLINTLWTVGYCVQIQRPRTGAAGPCRSHILLHPASLPLRDLLAEVPSPLRQGLCSARSLAVQSGHYHTNSDPHRLASSAVA